MTEEARSFVRIAAFTSLAEAELAASVLEADGIDVLLRNEAFASILPHMTNAVGGVEVTVSPEDVERAKEVLAANDAPRALNDAPEDEPDSEDDAVTAESPRDAMARRAWRSAVLGIVFLPVLLHLYSAALVVTYHLTGGSVAARSRWRIHAAFAIDTVVIAVASAIALG
jgi:hypothetical protein